MMLKYAVAWKSEYSEDITLEFVYADSEFEAAKQVVDSEDWEYESVTYEDLRNELWSEGGFNITVSKVPSGHVISPGVIPQEVRAH